MYIKFSALYVGQGAANFIEVYENKGDTRALSLILIDFGSAGKAGSASGGSRGNEDEPNRLASMEYIVGILSQNEGNLNLLILTHLDEDHINLVPDLVSEGGLLSVDKTIIGGTNSGITSKIHPFKKDSRMRKNVSRAVRTLAQAVVSICNNIQIFTADDGYLDTNDNIHNVENSAGDASLSFKLLANRSTPGIKGASEYINSNSSVTVAEYRGAGKHYAVIFPGDATADTFDFINKRFVKHRAQYSFLEAEKRVIIMPHHSSIKTACRGEVIKKNEKLSSQMSVTKTFADYINPTCVYTSAHYRAKRYYHPNRDSLALFSSNAETDTVHNVFGFKLRMACGYPYSDVKKFSPKYTLGTENYAKKVYTSHTICESIADHPVAYNGRGANGIGSYSGKTHMFCDLVCEIDGAVMTCTCQKLT